MTSVLLDTVSVTTDAFAGLSSTGVTYSTATLQWKNVSQSASDFRIVDDADKVYEDVVNVGGQATGTLTAKSLVPGESTKFYLERYEVDTWIRQTSTSSLDYVLVSTPTTKMSVATGSTSSKVTWPSTVESSSFTLTYSSGLSSSSAVVTISGSTAEASISGLTQGVSYDLTLTVDEGEVISLDTTSFTTSSAAQMQITGPFASYVGIDWTNSVDGNNSLYRIVNREGDSDDVLVESSTETNAVVQDLSPGSEYNIVLQRLELDGSWSDQNEVIANTLTTSISLSSVASKTIELSWSSLYNGAQFEIFYTESGGSPVGNGQTTDLVNVLRSLSPGTDYSIDLVVYELGQAVGLSKLGLTTNKGVTFPLTIAILSVIVMVIAFLMMKK